MEEKSFITDCEGPLTLNDNAFEIANHFIDSGAKLFKSLSLFDDYLVDVIKKPGYNAGNTLKFIIPFLKAENITNDDLIDFSKNNLSIVDNAKDTLTFIAKYMNSYIVSTSYGQYIKAVCDYMNFPFENTFYTFLDLDSFKLTDDEIVKINKLKEIILSLDPQKKDDLHILEKIFFNEIPKMNLNKYLSKIKTIGGVEKELAIKKIIANDKINKNEIFYIGDSITDVEPLNFSKKNNGISVSFNGNSYSLKSAEIAIISPNSLPAAILADIYFRTDKNHILNFINSYNNNYDLEESFNLYEIDNEISKNFFNSFNRNNYPIIKIINDDNIKKISKESQIVRSKIRGQNIAELG